MELREEEFYEQYHQHGGTTIIPTEIFNELYDDATEEIERLTISLQAQEELTMNECHKRKQLESIIKEVRERLLNENKPLPSEREIIEILDKEKE